MQLTLRHACHGFLAPSRSSSPPPPCDPKRASFIVSQPFHPLPPSHLVCSGFVTFGDGAIATTLNNVADNVTFPNKATPSVPCVTQIHRWLLTHNYIMSRAAMHKYNETVRPSWM